MDKLRQIKALKKDNDIKHLLDAAYKILLNPIAMFDTNYSLIAHTDAATDDPIWNELISTGTFNMETQKFFAGEHFTYTTSNADRLVILKSDELKYDRVLAYVFNRNRVKVALLVIVACNTSLDADDLLAFNAFADKITSKIRNDEHFTAYGWSYHDALITKILIGEIKDTRIYAPHIQILYDGFETYTYLHLAVIDAKKSGPQNGGLEYMRDLLRERYKSFKFAIYSGYIVMIMGSNQNRFDRRRILGKYDHFFKQNNIYAGVSSGFENLYELRKYFIEAVAALKSGAESNGNRHIHLFDNDLMDFGVSNVDRA